MKPYRYEDDLRATQSADETYSSAIPWMLGIVGGMGLVLTARLVFRSISSHFRTRSHRAPVSRADSVRAIETLRSFGREGLDSYFEEIDPANLMNTKLGPSDHCLNVDDLAKYAESSTVGIAHLGECRACAESLRIYKSVKEAARKPTGTLDVDVWLDPIGSLNVGDGPIRFDVRLNSDDPAPAELKWIQVETDLGNIESEQIECLSREDFVGATYVARCILSPRREVLVSLKKGTDVCDWIKFTGETADGDAFRTSDLVRLSCTRPTPGRQAAYKSARSKE